ncbi:hypothetical protein [Sinomicrobium weinanense]|uniref:Uncharacterized protein n=1 Tax=Sinomicrobium weinanense TaxID=2842200 RepID=A0A926JR26_9FLAO|nr:hypothetical protein [Sinomicrobium weinanense]MBC9795723.1 hypothetical protein [Sinomicrobium weinanense]MBU3125286.1 hypothetical protein [Sinomicrobium weinanense]
MEKIRISNTLHRANSRKACLYVILLMMASLYCVKLHGQDPTPAVEWIRPHEAKDKAIWGVRSGIVIGLWPSPIEDRGSGGYGGPRGLFRVGYEFKGKIYHINYIAIEPVVDGKIEFSEISPSRVDGKWGKLMWATEGPDPGKFFPFARTPGTVTRPDKDKPGVEELSFFVHMEQFLNGSHPYIKVSIRSDRPEEICFEVFARDNSSPMERCALTATMGNYARLRRLHLKDTVIDSRKLYQGFKGIDFIEKEPYSYKVLPRDNNGNFIAVMETDETFSELSSWPQESRYLSRWNWRYRPFFKVVQYWRKESDRFDRSLRVRVNGRAAYWAGASRDKNNYVEIPGGPAFENFELREKYYSGQKFYFGMARRPAKDMLSP